MKVHGVCSYLVAACLFVCGFITITSSASGERYGVISYSVASNSVPAPSGITIAGASVGTPPVYEGHLDGADCQSFVGWAWDSNQPNTAIEVDIYDGVSLIGTVAANQFRQDLLDAGKGNGVHGFTFATPGSLRDGQPHSFRVKFGGTSIDIGAPRTINCSGIQLEPVLSGLSSPLFLTNAGDQTNRLFIVEQGGKIKVLQPGTSTPTVFLDIAARVSLSGERGLLGLAFHPNFRNNRRFFVYYTRINDGALTVAQFHASATDPNVADTTEQLLMEIPHPLGSHNGGTIQFGADGFLYLGTGDGGSSNDPSNNGQNIEQLLGKILRIDVDHPNGSLPYSSPADNPFFGTRRVATRSMRWGCATHTDSRSTGERDRFTSLMLVKANGRR